MNQDQVKEAVLDIIRSISPDSDLSNVDAAEPLREQLDLDSMDFLDIVLELRRRHRIEVPEAEYGELATLDSCVAYLTPRFAAVGS